MEAASDGFSATMSTVTGAMLTAWASPNSYTTCILFGKVSKKTSLLKFEPHESSASSLCMHGSGARGFDG